MTTWGLKVPLEFHFLLVSVKILREYWNVKLDVCCRFCCSGCLNFVSVICRVVKSFLLLMFFNTATFDCLFCGCCMSLLHWFGRRRTSNPCNLHKKLAIPALAASNWWWPVQLLILVLDLCLGYFCICQSSWLGQNVVLSCRLNLLISSSCLLVSSIKFWTFWFMSDEYSCFFVNKLRLFQSYELLFTEILPRSICNRFGLVV